MCYGCCNNNMLWYCVCFRFFFFDYRLMLQTCLFPAVTHSLCTAIKAATAASPPPCFVDAPWHAAKIQALLTLMDVAVARVVCGGSVQQAASSPGVDPALDA